MKQNERIEKIIELMDKEYGTDYICYLNHTNAFQLLIASIAAALMMYRMRG